jgi:hypothetical protein
MRILIVGDFRYDSPHYLLNNPRMFGKGFIRNGHDVLEFGYRDRLLGLSPIRSKRWAVTFAKTKTDNLLFSLAREHKSDLVLIAAFKLLDAGTIAGLKETLPHARFVCWYSDMYNGPDPKIEPIARQCDWFLSSGGGDILHAYKKIGAKHCAFMPNPCDPDIHYSRKVDARWHSDLLFTGKFCHGQGGQDPMREQLLKYLIEHKRLTVWGDMGKPAIKGDDYINAICGTDIAISINAFNNIRFYHSDRLIHYLACGAFTLAKQVPDSDLLFENNKHICYFSSQEECLELINRFQVDTSQRQKIAEAGMKHAHETFACEKLAGDIIDLATKGEYDESWKEIV